MPIFERMCDVIGFYKQSELANTLEILTQVFFLENVDPFIEAYLDSGVNDKILACLTRGETPLIVNLACTTINMLIMSRPSELTDVS